MKRFISIITALILVCAFTVPAVAEYQDMWAKVYRWTGKYGEKGPLLEPVTTGITFEVLARGTSTRETTYVYGKNKLTSLTNPITTTLFASSSYCNGMVAFRVDPTDSTYDRYVDLRVVDTNGGFTAIVKDFDKYNHAIVIDERPNIYHQGSIWFSGAAATETSTGVTFLADTQIRSMQVQVTQNLASSSVNIGLLSSESGGDADGFLALAATTSTGYITTSAASHGVLLGNGTIVYPNGHTIVSSAASTLTYTTSSDGAGGTKQAGYIHFGFIKVR